MWTIVPSQQAYHNISFIDGVRNQAHDIAWGFCLALQAMQMHARVEQWSNERKVGWAVVCDEHPSEDKIAIIITYNERDREIFTQHR